MTKASGSDGSEPSGWIDSQSVFQRVRARIADALGGDDPAPWLSEKTAAFWGPLTPAQISDHKLDARTGAVLQSALLAGNLTGSLFDGVSTRDLPPAAFEDAAAVIHAFKSRTLELDPLWSDDWQEWNGKSWRLREDQFENWLASADVENGEGIPVEIDLRAADLRFRAEPRPPTNRSRVALSEAVSWLALGTAFDAGRLERALRWGRFGDGDLGLAIRRLEGAASYLLEAGADGKITFYGRHQHKLGAQDASTEKIYPLELADYAEALIFGKDHLYFGNGLRVLFGLGEHSIALNVQRQDFFSDVTVSRAELIAFQKKSPNASVTQPRFNDTERRQWIKMQAMMSADAAHKIYREHRRFCGTKLTEFRQEWRETKGTKRGRPIKSTIK